MKRIAEQTAGASNRPPSSPARQSRPLFWLALFAATTLATVLADWFLQARLSSGVSYQGRTIGGWFIDLAKSDWSNYSSDIRTNRAAIAFLDMEGDAVRFLAHRCAWGWSPMQSGYASIYQRLPPGLKSKLPAPRPDPRGLALWMLGAIGQKQEEKKLQGKPGTRLSVEAAMPAIRKILWDSSLRYRACSTISQCGSLANPAIPDLIAVAAAEYASNRVDGIVLCTLGDMGAAASNAIPLLCTIASDPAHKTAYHLAVRALGDIGPSARPAAHLIASHLAKEGTSGDPVSLVALARIGVTPPEAVPVLRKAMDQGKPLCQVYAMVALWRHDPANPELRENINALLTAATARDRAPQNAREADARFLVGPLLATLRLQGADAAVFTPAVRRIVESGDPVLTNLATICLHAIQAESEWPQPKATSGTAAAL